MEQKPTRQPSAAFIAASWIALITGVVAYNIGLWNAGMQLNEKGYYFTVLILGLFSAVSVQKAVRDQLEGIPVTNLYYGLAWFTTLLAVLLLTIGLWNAELTRSEKGFYAMSFVLSLFAAVAVQKNVRDSKVTEEKEEPKNTAGNATEITSTYVHRKL
ncbi:inner membrane protein YiaA [Foetidibacter luteolus]|uniref:inner membrane protein YiaA n=1 Tax=Foetidibacter luteolus TaxID=2608880 RepID=UPI00129A6EF8|nr:inner membrane protein YiaA [Foetidibacter luteolus]